MKKTKDLENLTYEDFREMASDNSLSKYEKIGFPDSYRKDKEGLIFKDICLKLKNINASNKRILDIGCGVSDLPLMLIEQSERNNNTLYFIDSKEVLETLPDSKCLTKVEAFYPKCESFIQDNERKFDSIIVYSVLHYIFIEANLFEFLDKTLSMLSHGGELLIGDIPNISMRKRFFASPGGVDFHKKFMNTDESPKIDYNIIEEGKIDDSVMYSLLMRARNQGFHSYLLPQNDSLPMSNRREDILIIRP